MTLGDGLLSIILIIGTIACTVGWFIILPTIGLLYMLGYLN